VTSETRVEEALERGAHNAKDTSGHRLMWGLLAVVLAGLLLLAVAVLGGKSRESELQRSVTALAEQVTQLGGTPVVNPPGIPGPEGPAGAAGRDGTDGRDGVDGTTAPCATEPAQCRGEPGRPGADGTGVQGEPGVAGQDATGVPGPQGVPGTPGEKGDPGQAGAPPAGWTWTDSTGRPQSCTRDAGSPDSAPTYTCTAPSPELTGLPILRRS
jgi:hypothetical protein